MRISDWSSDVCSSDLRTPHRYILGVAALNDLGDADFDVRNVESPERRAVPRRTRRSGKSLGAEEAGEGDAEAPATTRQRSSRFALHSHEHPPRHRSEQHTSELQSPTRISSPVSCSTKKKNN